MVIMNDLDKPMLSYYVIYYQKFKKVMQQTEKEALSCLFVDVFSPHIYMQAVYLNKQSHHKASSTSFAIIN